MAQTAFSFDSPSLPAHGKPPFRPATPSPHDEVGHELGMDHARHGLLPPAEHLLPANPLRQGWDAGRTRFGQRTLSATPAVRSWLQLRLQAWMSGLSFEPVQVTPHYLGQLEASHCPVTRQALGDAQRLGCVARVNPAAGFAAGNLAVLSPAVQQARGARPWDEVRALAAQATTRPDGRFDGLHADDWERLAVLMSFVTPLAHEVAAALPLRVLPPNRLRLLNPVQGLQVLITRFLLQPGYAARSAQFAALLESATGRRDYQLVFLSLLPRAWDGGRPASLQARRERLEDAWRCPQLQRRWQRFARGLSASQATTLLERAVAAGLAGQPQQVQLHSCEGATEGWSLDSGGLRTPATGPVRGLARGPLAPVTRRAGRPQA